MRDDTLLRWHAAVRDTAPDVPAVLRVMVACVLAAPDLEADSLLFVADALADEAQMQAAAGEAWAATQLRVLADLVRTRPPSRVRHIQDCAD